MQLFSFFFSVDKYLFKASMKDFRKINLGNSAGFYLFKLTIKTPDVAQVIISGGVV